MINNHELNHELTKEVKQLVVWEHYTVAIIELNFERLSIYVDEQGDVVFRDNPFWGPLTVHKTPFTTLEDTSKWITQHLHSFFVSIPYLNMQISL
ncbi:hypothetical protein H6G11_17075 [Cyanobacterium aponinum FACHB-4101]|uniref:hypothetical protein n=1 Tax=Cyanobacterium aponinum TaxID=379064 RepID=UPI0016806EB9|nr:hypothetical protein [Cyanobacterium aponinum]MBD2395960.1 hypothetical protein [Cyanobacterium aponinum FACHB-4101]